MRRGVMALGAACFVLWALASWAWPSTQVALLEWLPPWGLRLVDLLLHAAAIIVMWRAYAPRFVGLCVAVVYGLWYAGAGPGLVGSAEGWVALGSVMCFAPLLFKRVPDWGFTLAGAFAGSATMVAPAYGLWVVVPLVAWLAQREARSLLFLIAGFVLPVAGCIGYMAATDAHAMGGVFGTRDSGGFVASVGAHVFASKLTLLLPFAAFGAHALRGRFPRRFHIIGAWALAAFVVLCLGGGPGEAGWLPVYPPLFVLGGVGLKVIARSAMPFVRVTLAVMVLQAAWAPFEATRAWLMGTDLDVSLAHDDVVVARDAAPVDARLATRAARVEGGRTGAADITPRPAHAAAREAQADARHAVDAQVLGADLALGDHRHTRAAVPRLARGALGRGRQADPTEAAQASEP